MCGSMITIMVCSKSMDEGTLLTQDKLLTTLDGLLEDHTHCTEQTVMTLCEANIIAVEEYEEKI